MLTLTNTNKALWDGFTGEVRADYLDLMEETPRLPQRPRTEAGMTAWAVHARDVLLDEAMAASKRGITAAITGNLAVAASWRDRGGRHLAMARELGDLMGLPGPR